MIITILRSLVTCRSWQRPTGVGIAKKKLMTFFLMIMNTFVLPQKHQIIKQMKSHFMHLHHVINSIKSQNEFYKFEYCFNLRPTFYMRISIPSL